MQLWPACEKACSLALSAAVSQSPSAWTISGAFEPSSRLTFLWGTLLRIPQPTGAEPVKVIARVSSCSTIALPTSEPGPGMTLSQPSGRPASTQDLGQLQRRDRRLPGGLEDDRVAGGDRRAELVGDEVEREVEGADRADDPVGDAQHHAELAGAGGRGLHRHRAAGQLARLDRGEGRACRRSARPRPSPSSAACRPRRRSSGPAPRSARATSSAARSSTAARSCWGKSAASKASWAASIARSTSAASPWATRPTDGAVVGALDLGPLAGLDPLAGDEELVVDRLDRLRRHARPPLASLFQPRA